MQTIYKRVKMIEIKNIYEFAQKMGYDFKNLTISDALTLKTEIRAALEKARQREIKYKRITIEH